VYVFVDIACQIFYQGPWFGVAHPTDGQTYLDSRKPIPDNSTVQLPMSRYLGFDKIYQINHSLMTLEDLIMQYADQYNGASDQPLSPLVTLDVQNLYYFILKSMNLFFIFLLIQIYKSAGYKKFLRTDLR
jgi:hypothetical protein